MNVRLRRFMCHTCDLYRPSTIMPITASGEMADAIYQPIAAYTGVTSHLQATPEFDNPQLQGLTKQVNELTSDRWHFLAEQEIADGWAIVMKTVGHPDYGHAWIVQGNAMMNASQPGRPTDSQWLYAKLAPTNTIPLSASVNSVSTASATALVH